MRLKAARFRRTRRQIAGTEPHRRRFQSRQPAASRAEDDHGGQRRRDDQQQRAREGKDSSEIACHRAARRQRRQDRYAAQLARHLNRRHDDRGFESRLTFATECPAGDHRVNRAADVVAERLRPVRRHATVFHDDDQRLDAAVLPCDERLKVQSGILGERGADISGDDRGDVVRRTARKRTAPRQDVVEQRALRRQHQHDEHDEAETDAEVEASVPGRPTRGARRGHVLERNRNLTRGAVPRGRRARGRDELGGQAVREDPVGEIRHRVRAPRGTRPRSRTRCCSRPPERQSASPFAKPLRS
jgi:hypothetical protein